MIYFSFENKAVRCIHFDLTVFLKGWKQYINDMEWKTLQLRIDVWSISLNQNICVNFNWLEKKSKGIKTLTSTQINAAMVHMYLDIRPCVIVTPDSVVHSSVSAYNNIYSAFKFNFFCALKDLGQSILHVHTCIWYFLLNW